MYQTKLLLLATDMVPINGVMMVVRIQHTETLLMVIITILEEVGGSQHTATLLMVTVMEITVVTLTGHTHHTEVMVMAQAMLGRLN